MDAGAFAVLCTRVPPHTQQHLLLPVLHAANAKNVFFVFHVRPDATKVADQIKQRALRIHLQPLKPALVRTKLLHLCKQERVRDSKLLLAFGHTHSLALSLLSYSFRL